MADILVAFRAVGREAKTIFYRIMSISSPTPVAPFGRMDIEPSATPLRDARLRDPFGDRIHFGLAMIFLASLPLATSPKDYAMGLLFIWSVARLHHTWRSYRALLRVPSVYALLAWAILCAVSLSWSLDPKQGFDEFGALRMLLVPLLLWPVLDRLPWLIAAVLAGVLAQNFTQLLQALDWVDVRAADKRRVAGWIHPIKTGAYCAAAMCWLLSASLRGRGGFRLGSIVLFTIASIGLVGTASRGTWLAAAITIPAMLLILAVRRPDLRKTILVLCVLGGLGAAAAWPFVGQEIRNRSDTALRELQKAQDREIYWTSVGARIGMTRWAIDIFEKNPVVGVGVGGYPTAQAAEPSFQRALDRADNHSEFMDKDHPHSIYLYTLACLGSVGAVFLLIMIFTTLWQAWRDPPNHVFADGTFFAMLTWFIGAQFDCYNLDGSRLGLFGVMIAASLPFRPAIRPARLLNSHRRDEGTLAMPADQHDGVIE